MLLYYSCVMFSILHPSVLYFPCYVEAFLDSKLELNFSRKKKIPKIFQRIFCSMDRCNLFLDTNVLLFDVLIILIHHLVFQYPFSILSFTILCDTSVSSVKKINFKSKGKTILSQVAWLFFSYFMSDGHIF